jgi:predicted ATPase
MKSSEPVMVSPMANADTHMHVAKMNDSDPFLKRVGIQNYKSIGACYVELGAVTILVGRNGSGKSNFLDGLRLVADGLQTSLDHAIKSRGGIDAVRRRSTGHPRNFAVRLEMNLKDWSTAIYRFEVGSEPEGVFFVKQEELRVMAPNNRCRAHYVVHAGKVQTASTANMPPAAKDRLYLVNAAGLPDFREVYDALLAMGFYNVNPESMKELQSPDAKELLHHDGGNVASVVARLKKDQPETAARIIKYLSTIVDGITDVDRVVLGPRETLEFRQGMEGAKHPWRFYAGSMSDGTLRALGTLVAVMQLVGRREPVRMVGIEEPETALHPAAAGALMDALREASVRTQILVTTHSPDLVDQVDPEKDRLLAVQVSQGSTDIGPVDTASREAIRRHLYSPGELLRMNQLRIDPSDLRQQRQMNLFASTDEELP